MSNEEYLLYKYYEGNTKRFGLHNEFVFKRGSHQCQSMISLDVRKKIWNFWLDQGHQSTNTTNLASSKRLSEKPKKA